MGGGQTSRRGGQCRGGPASSSPPPVSRFAFFAGTAFNQDSETIFYYALSNLSQSIRKVTGCELLTVDEEIQLLLISGTDRGESTHQCSEVMRPGRARSETVLTGLGVRLWGVRD